MTHEDGERAYCAMKTSRHYAQFDLATVRPRDAMRLFLPPVPEDSVQMARPLPPLFAEWCEGFLAARDADRAEVAGEVEG